MITVSWKQRNAKPRRELVCAVRSNIGFLFHGFLVTPELITYFYRYLDAARSGLCHSQKLHIHSGTTHRCRHSKGRSRSSALGVGYWEAEAEERLSPQPPGAKCAGIFTREIITSLTFPVGNVYSWAGISPESPCSDIVLQIYEAVRVFETFYSHFRPRYSKQNAQEE